MDTGVIALVVAASFASFSLGCLGGLKCSFWFQKEKACLEADSAGQV